MAKKTSANKTVQTDSSPESFIASIENATRRKDAEFLLTWFKEVTGLEPKLWGPTIIGYGRYHYKYDSGREGDSLITGFSPRKSALSIYIMPGYNDFGDKLNRLGKHKIGKSCLYINKLADIDIGVLQEIVEEGVAHMKEHYKTDPE